MNILFFYNSSLDPLKGGIGRCSNVLADYFECKGHKVYFLSRIKSSEYECDRQKYLPQKDNFLCDKNVSFFLEYLSKNKINIVINQSGMSKEASRLAYYSKQKGVKVFSVIHNTLLDSIRNFSSLYYDRAAKYCIQWLLPLTNLQFIKNTLLKLYRRKYKEHYTELCSKSDKVVLLSEKYVSDLKFFVGDKYTEKIIWIPNPTSFNVSDSELLTIEKKKKAIFVGTIDFTYKRVDLLLEIWQKTSKKHPECQLMIVGGGNGLKKAKDLSQKLNLKNVTFEGFQNPKKYYEDASIFCMTSSCEGFGIVLIEAMQYGVVPIAFDSYVSARDIIDSKINGVLVKPFDLEKYVDELCKLIEDNEYLTRLSKEALTKSKEFSAKKIGDIWLNNFATMLGESV